MTAKFMMFIGLPGSGKTYTRHNIEDRVSIFSISSDYYISDTASHLGLSYNQVFEDLIKMASLRVQADIMHDTFLQYNVILDQTNLTKKSRVNKLALIKNRSRYKVIGVTFTPDLELIKSRLMLRESLAPGKTVSDTVFNTMLASYQPPTLEEGFDEILDNEEFLTKYYKSVISRETVSNPLAGRPVYFAGQTLSYDRGSLDIPLNPSVLVTNTTYSTTPVDVERNYNSANEILAGYYNDALNALDVLPSTQG